jgi:hypothetical protein
MDGHKTSMDFSECAKPSMDLGSRVSIKLVSRRGWADFHGMKSFVSSGREQREAGCGSSSVVRILRTDMVHYQYS